MTDNSIENMDQAIEEPKMKCKFCPTYAFITKKDYLLHIEKKHKDKFKDKIFMCSECGKRFKSNSELTVHNDSKCGALKQFGCKICGKNMMSAGSLYNHMIRHSGKKSYMCLYCAKQFATGGQLKVHERIHTQDRAFVCKICKKGFCHRQSLITHQTLHTGIKPYLCENCGNSFSCIGNLLKHRKTHPDTCGLTPLTTHSVRHPATKIKVKINTPENVRLKTKKEQLEDEIETLKTELAIRADESTAQEFKEEPCNEETKRITEEEAAKSSNQSAMPDRVKEESNGEADNSELQMEDSQDEMDEPELVDIHHISDYCSDEEGECEQKKPEENKPQVKIRDGEKVTKCRRLRRKCKKETVEREEMDENTSDELSTVPTTECKLCGKKYKKSKWLDRHMKDHELDKHKFKCNLCKMAFDSKEERSNHRRSAHIDLLTCNECDKVFSHRDGLRYHQNIYHKGLAKKCYSYVCEKCGKQFKQKSYLTSHEYSNCSQGPFHQCKICDRKFASKYTMKTHMRTHSDDKQFSCRFCPKSFHWNGQLKIHERSHTGEKPFACTSCPKAFAYRESLLTHMTLHTGIKPYLCQGCGLRFSCVGNLIKHKSRNAAECGAWTYKTYKGRLPVMASDANENPDALGVTKAEAS